MQRALLDEWRVARLATVASDGQPHVVPIVFCAQDDALYSPIDAKLKKSTRLKRFANVASNPQVSVLLDHYDESWEQLWWVRFDGVVERSQPNAARAEAIAAALERKYPQYAELPFDRTTYLKVTPTRVVAWAQAGTSAAIAASLEAS